MSGFKPPQIDFWPTLICFFLSSTSKCTALGLRKINQLGLVMPILQSLDASLLAETVVNQI